MKRKDFKLYDVVDTVGRTKGLKNNCVPVERDEAERIAANNQMGKPKLVRTKDRAWEDYVWRQRHGKKGAV